MMHTGHLEDELVQRFFDGELSNGSAVEVRQHLDNCQECLHRYRSLERLHRYINIAAQEISSEVDFERLYNDIESGVNDSIRSDNVIPIQRLIIRSKSKMAKVLLPAALAAAAVFLFIILQESPKENVIGHSSDRTRSPKTVLVERGKPLPLPNSEVIQVDFGEHTGTVFEIALAEGVSTPVVWINDEMEEMVDP